MEKAGDIYLRFTHPEKELSFLADTLQLTCSRCWKAGNPRQAPNGQPQEGINKNSYWASRQEIKQGEGFTSQLASLLKTLEREKNIVLDLKKSGGKVAFYLQFAGSINTGDDIDVKILKSMSELGIDLMIEIFPDM